MQHWTWHKKISHLLLIISIFSYAYPTSSAEKPFDPIGQWRTFHKDGNSFVLTLYADGTASSTADNQKGGWQWKGSAVYIEFTDGWMDVIEIDDNGTMVKKSWAPDANRSKPSQNISSIKKISNEAAKP